MEYIEKMADSSDDVRSSSIETLAICDRRGGGIVDWRAEYLFAVGAMDPMTRLGASIQQKLNRQELKKEKDEKEWRWSVKEPVFSHRRHIFIYFIIILQLRLRRQSTVHRINLH